MSWDGILSAISGIVVADEVVTLVNIVLVD